MRRFARSRCQCQAGIAITDESQSKGTVINYMILRTVLIGAGEEELGRSGEGKRKGGEQEECRPKGQITAMVSSTRVVLISALQAVFDELVALVDPGVEPYKPTKGKVNVLMAVGIQVGHSCRNIRQKLILFREREKRRHVQRSAYNDTSSCSVQS